MIVYYGTPIGGNKAQAARFLLGRHALVPFSNPRDLAMVVECCSSFVVDNGAYSAWTQGVDTDWPAYYEWVRSLRHIPSFDWAVIPDKIGGSVDENDELVAEWPRDLMGFGMPVWHAGEPENRLDFLCHRFGRAAIGAHPSHQPGTQAWWESVGAALDYLTDENGMVPHGYRLHGLRMLNPAVFTHIPLASADSASLARNSHQRHEITPSEYVRYEISASRIEIHNAPTRWAGRNQTSLWPS